MKQDLRTFHIAYYIDNEEHPLMTGVTYKEISIQDAIRSFLYDERTPDNTNVIRYIEDKTK
jgi:hypothetical protein